MPRTFGKCRAILALKVVPAEFAAYLALTLTAMVLALTLLVSQAHAASEESSAVDTLDTDLGATESDIDPSAPSQTGATERRAGGLTLEGLIYRRSDLETVPFTKQGGSDGTPWVLVDSSELDGDTYSPGIRASLQGTVLDQPIELSAFFVTPFSLDLTQLGLNQSATDMVYFPPPIIGNGIDGLPNSDNSYGIIAHHETKLFGAEANLVEPLGIPALVLGARAIYFGEHLSTTAIKRAVDVPPSDPANTQRDHAGVRIDNQLIGVQLGLQHMFDIGDVMRIGGSVKGGLYQNFVDRNMTLVAENRLDRSWEGNTNDSVFAQGIEFNPRIEFKLAEGTYLTAAGQFLWLNNVATALPHYANVGNPDDHDVRADDDVFFYGGSLGLTILLDGSSPTSNSLSPFAHGAPSSSAIEPDDLDERVAALEETTAHKGNSKVSLSVHGWINRMLLAWDDGVEKDVYVVDNVASRSRIGFYGAAQIARGWSAGYLLQIGLDDTASNDVSQLTAAGDQQVQVRHSAWWVRNNQLGTLTMGHTSTATDNIILKDVGGIMPGAANLATVGGGFWLRRADFYGQGDDGLIISGAFTTPLNDIIAGASVDTLRRNVVRYDAPRISGQWGNIDLSAAWGEDDFYDFAVEHGINYNDWKFRFGAGYLHNLDEGTGDGRRDREEYKGSASLLHIPTGLFATAAYVRRTFHGSNTSQQVTFGENVVEILDPNRPNRPPIDYLYTASGLRRAYWSIGDTSIYGEYAQVWDSVKGMREAGLLGVTDSRVMMLGAAICQDIDDAGMDVYAGVRVYSIDTEGIRTRSGVSYVSPVPLTDFMFAYAGTRIKF
jgi:hypothetical protein